MPSGRGGWGRRQRAIPRPLSRSRNSHIYSSTVPNPPRPWDGVFRPLHQRHRRRLHLPAHHLLVVDQSDRPPALPAPTPYSQDHPSAQGRRPGGPLCATNMTALWGCTQPQPSQPQCECPGGCLCAYADPIISATPASRAAIWNMHWFPAPAGTRPGLCCWVCLSCLAPGSGPGPAAGVPATTTLLGGGLEERDRAGVLEGTRAKVGTGSVYERYC